MAKSKVVKQGNKWFLKKKASAIPDSSAASNVSNADNTDHWSQHSDNSTSADSAQTNQEDMGQEDMTAMDQGNKMSMEQKRGQKMQTDGMMMQMMAMMKAMTPEQMQEIMAKMKEIISGGIDTGQVPQTPPVPQPPMA